MGAPTRSVDRWTRYFAAASALALVGTVGLGAAGVGRHVRGLFGLFGFVCPMIFGMAYLLLPPYVGRTLAVRRLPGVHFVAAYLGAGLLVAGEAFDLPSAVFGSGAVLWSVGVGLFLGSLLWTTLPGLVERPEVVLRSDERPQRSSRAATAAIPVALGYLGLGTVGLLGLVDGVPAVVSATVPRVLHAYGAGFGALLVFALGARLLVGFFHVEPPRAVVWLVLATGALAPGLLTTHLWVGPWFRVGAVLEATAMGGYAALVGSVAVRSDRSRVGLYGIALGALAGVAAVGTGLLVALGVGRAALLDVHALLVIQGFFALTIVGYAFQFFPVTTGRFPGATERAAVTTIALLAAGLVVRTVGVVVPGSAVSLLGVGVSLAGAVGYAYLVGRRLLAA